MRLRSILLVCCAAVPLTVRSAQLPMQNIFTEKNPIKLEIQENDNSQTIAFPAVKKQQEQSVCLSFKAYFKADSPGGWNNTMAISLNGRELNKTLLNGTLRLLSRGDVMLTSDARSRKNEWWSNFQGSNCLLMLIGNGTDLDKRILKPRNEGYTYTLDVSDLVNYVEYGADDRIENAAPNRLTFTNKLLSKMLGNQSKLKWMMIENLKVVYIPTEDVDKARDAVLYKFKFSKPAAKLDAKNFTLKVAATGGMKLNVAGDNYYLESFFSYPAVPAMKDNTLGTCSAPGQTTWNPAVKQISDSQIEITAQAEDYTLQRTIKLDPPRIRFEDSITNTSTHDTGIRIRNLFGQKGLPLTGSYRIAGFSGTSFAEFSFSTKNPTIFVENGKSSLGLVAEDNVYRIMLQLRKKNNIFVAAAENFALQAGKSHTFEWTLYPAENKGYYGFINQVRRDWNVNYTVQSAILVGDKGHQTPTKQNVFVIGPWFEYHNGAKYTDAQFKEIYTTKIKAIKSARPDALVIPKVENNLVPFDVKDCPDGKLLPARHGKRNQPGVKYGQFLNPAQTAIVNRSPLKDSIIRSATGAAMIDNFYTEYPFINLMVQPERGNARYKQIMRQMDFLTDQCGFDGIFMDQFIPMPLGGISYDKWDGVSVELDKTGKIKSKYYNYALTGASARMDIIKHVIDKGKMYIHNGLPLVKETRSLPAMRFQEMENDSFVPMLFIDKKPPELKWVCLGHLSSPITLGLRLKRYSPKGEDRSAQILTKGIITALRNGSLYYYYTMDIGPEGSHAPSDHMFPFTPVEINEGFMIGKERIITCISRKFNWPHKTRPAILLFDKCGNVKKHNFTVNSKDTGWEIGIKLDDWNEIAIIEEAPIK